MEPSGPRAPSWTAIAPEPACEERGRVRRLPGVRPRRPRPPAHRELGEQHRVMWEHPSMARYLDRLGRFARVICFDKRGAGISDPVSTGALPTLEHWVDDARAVLDARRFGERRAPGRRRGRPGDDVRRDVPAADARPRAGEHLRADAPGRRPRSGCPSRRPSACSSRGSRAGAPTPRSGSRRRASRTTHLQRWARHYMRLSATPAMAAIIPLGAPARRAVGAAEHPGADPRAPQGREPALPGGHGAIPRRAHPGAKYVELPGADWYPPFVDAEGVLDEVEEFLTGDRPAPPDDRILATVMFTDIVGSTDLAARIGDQRWLDVKAARRARARAPRALSRARDRHDGRWLPRDLRRSGRAVRCASEIATAVESLDISVRAGLHTGEVELQDGQVAGIAVHIAARVMAHAEPGRVLVSGTVTDLVVGSGIRTTISGPAEGRAGEWRLFEFVGLS